MNRFIINKPNDFEAAVKTIVRQSFPFASPSTTILDATEAPYRFTSGTETSRIAGSKREKFTWGSSLIGGSFLVG